MKQLRKLNRNCSLSPPSNARSNSVFENELDGAIEVRNDMGAPFVCRIAKLNIVSNNQGHMCCKAHTGIVPAIYMQLVISLNERLCRN